MPRVRRAPPAPLAACAALLAPLALGGPARADVVHLRDGRTLEGRVEETEGGVRVLLRHGAVEVPRADVVRVEPRETPEEVLARRIVDLPARDLDAALDLGRFCVEHGFEREARLLARHAEGLAPAHPGVAALYLALDFMHREGAWQPPEVHYPARGWGKVRGRWAPPEELRAWTAWRALQAAEAAHAEAVVLADEAGRAVERLRARLATIEGKLTTVRGGRGTAEAAVAAARRALEASEAELRAAEARAAESNRVHAGWVLAPCPGDPRWALQRQLLLNELLLRQADLTRARQARDAAQSALRRVVDEEALLARLEGEGTTARLAAEAELAPALERAAAARAAADAAVVAHAAAAAEHEAAKAARRAAQRPAR